MDAHGERRRRTRWTRPPIMMHASLNSLHILYTHAIIGIGDNKGGNKEGVARLVETLAFDSIGKSTQKTLLAKWNTWVTY